MTAKPPPINPWGLSEREYAAMVLTLRHGHTKLVAQDMRISTKGVEQHIHAAKKKMEVRHKLLAVIKFDRWRRAMKREGWSKVA